MLRHYPIGLQRFQEIREGGYVYIDKTEAIHQLVITGNYYFLTWGRCDILVKTDLYIYVLELKLDKPAAEAIQQ